MNLVVLTYDAPHRKTQDVVARLLFAGIPPADMTLLAYPWVERKPRRFLYFHRPAEEGWGALPFGGEGPRLWGPRVGIECVVVQAAEMYDSIVENAPDIVLVAGAGLIEPRIVNRFKVLNVHPGLLPQSRGLDILKWTILSMDPVGVTAHLCDERPDLGWLIDRKPVPVYRNDTFHALALRQYEMELDLILPALETVMATEKDGLERLEDIGSESRMRMPRKVEAALMDAFERYKLVYGI